MEIKEGIYDIPSGYRVQVMPGGKQLSIQKRKDRHIQPTDYRCKDCLHRVEGKVTLNCWWKTYACEMRPKKNHENIFYAAPYYQKACGKFELKSEEI